MMFVSLLVFTAYFNAALTQHSTPSKVQPYYPKWNLKPGTSFKVIPPSYNPSDICFNPHYYGLFRIGDISHTSPTLQPNIYYNLPVAPWPVWTCDPNPNPDCVPPKPLNPTVSHPESAIKVTRPTMTVQITPPTFNENATTVTNKRGDIDYQQPTNGLLDEKSRKMIKQLLQFGSKHKRSNDPNDVGENSEIVTNQLDEKTRDMIKLLLEINKKYKRTNHRSVSDEEIVIASATQPSP